MLGWRCGLSIRSAKASDCHALADVFGQSWRGAYRGIIPHAHLESIIRRRGRNWWLAALRGEERPIVLVIDDVVAGYATFGPARGGKSAMGEIYELYLRPGYQGLGLGEHLFEACRNELDVRGFQGLIVWALGDNDRATEFYWHRGGRPVATSRERIGGVGLEKIAFVWP